MNHNFSQLTNKPAPSGLTVTVMVLGILFAAVTSPVNVCGPGIVSYASLLWSVTESNSSALLQVHRWAPGRRDRALELSQMRIKSWLTAAAGLTAGTYAVPLTTTVKTSYPVAIWHGLGDRQV